MINTIALYVGYWVMAIGGIALAALSVAGAWAAITWSLASILEVCRRIKMLDRVIRTGIREVLEEQEREREG